ncbi:MAG: MBL fold metallo-hydrolase [Thermodesulfobacteriota bacterium]
MIEETLSLESGIRLHRFAGVVSNVYLIENRQTDSTILIDCGMPSDAPKLIEALDRMPPAVAVCCTHFHIDHIGAWRSLNQRWPRLEIRFSVPAKPYVTGRRRLHVPSPTDIRDVLLPCMTAFGYRPNLKDIVLGRLYGTPLHAGFWSGLVRYFPEDRPSMDGFDILATPGHTPDSISIFHPNSGVLICGDTFLWLNGTLQENPFVTDAAAQRRTIAFLRRLGDGVILCPGHGPTLPLSQSIART